MQIEVKGRNVPVNDELRELVERKFRKVAAQVSDLARMEVELHEERNPKIADSQVAGVTLYLKGVTLHAECASREIEHSIRLCSDELARQVKRHRDKRRRRREARGRAATGRQPSPTLDQPVRTRRASPAASVSSSPMALLDRALRMGEAKQFKQFEKRVARINDFEPELELESMEELRERTDSLREQARNGAKLDDLLPETFAIVREVGKREMGMRHFDVQMIGGMVLHSRLDRRDEDRRGQDADGDARRRAQRAARPRRPRRDGQRLPRPPRRRVDEPDLPPAGARRRRAAEHAADRREARLLRRRRDVRDELRVRLRLPARQHGLSRWRRRCSAAIRSRSSTRSTTSSSTRRAPR